MQQMGGATLRCGTPDPVSGCAQARRTTRRERRARVGATYTTQLTTVTAASLTTCLGLGQGGALGLYSHRQTPRAASEHAVRHGASLPPVLLHVFRSCIHHWLTTQSLPSELATRAAARAYELSGCIGAARRTTMTYLHVLLAMVTRPPSIACRSLLLDLGNTKWVRDRLPE